MNRLDTKGFFLSLSGLQSLKASSKARSVGVVDTVVHSTLQTHSGAEGRALLNVSVVDWSLKLIWFWQRNSCPQLSHYKLQPQTLCSGENREDSTPLSSPF